MRGWLRNVWIMWLSQLCVNVGFAAAFPFVPLYMRDAFGIVDAAQRGIYMSRFYFFGVLAYAIFTPVWGVLGDRFGVKLMLYRGSFVSAFLYPLMGLVPNVQMLIALRFVIGSLSGTTIAAQMLLAKTTPNERQGFALGVLGTAIWGGAMAGDVIGGLVVHYFGYMAAFSLCGALFFLSGICVIFALDSEKAPVSAVSSRRAGRRGSHLRSFLPRQLCTFRGTFTPAVRLMLLIFLASGIAQKLNIPFTALMIESIEGPERAAFWTGIVGAFAAGVSMVSGVLIGTLSDRMPEWKLTTPAQLLSALMLFLAAGTSTLFGFGFCHAANSFAVGGLYSVFQKVTSTLVPGVKRGTVLGWATTMYNVGFMLSTVISGAVVSAWGLGGVYRTAGVLMALFAVVSALVIRWATRDRDAAARAQRLGASMCK